MPRAVRAAALSAVAAALLTAADVPLRFEPPRYSRGQMEAALASGESWLLVYGTRDPELAKTLELRARAVARRMLGGDTSAVVADRDATRPAIAGRSVILFGGPRSNDWTARLAAALPLQFTANGFHWVDRDYEEPGDAIHLVYPNPLAPRRFLVLIAGNSAAAMAGRGGGFFLAGDDWRIVRDGELARSGTFEQSGARPWRYDPRRDRDRERERDAFRASLVRVPGRHVTVAAPARRSDAARVAAAGDALVAEMQRLGVLAPAPVATGEDRGPLSVTLFRDLEEKARFTRNSRPEHVDVEGAASMSLPAGHRDYDLWSIAAAALVRAGADPDSRFLAPAGVWLAGRLGGEPLERAVGRLYYGRLLPSAAEAATDDSLWRSPLVWVPARALLARSVFECAGATALRKLLATDVPARFDELCRRVGADPAGVERRYLELATTLSHDGARRSSAHEPPRPWRLADGFQRGVCFAHAVSLERGYLSASAQREIETLRDLGANWLSITPFGYLPGPDVPVIYPSATAGLDEETDEALVEVVARARALGMRVWLTPHLWTRDWVGRLEFGAEGWPRFFEQYRRFMVHYALLAEREGIDGLVVGHELPTASLRFPERWRALIGEVRRVYSGTLTYGANWNAEVDRVGFWDALDVIGVSFYDPIAERSTRSVAELTSGAKKALSRLRALSRRTGRAVVLLEAGYASTPSAPVRPWDEEGGPPDPETQRACYEALCRALEPEDWVAGVFWWKWPSAPVAGGPADRSFTPRGKPAQEVMARAFREWRGRPVRPAQR